MCLQNFSLKKKPQLRIESLGIWGLCRRFTTFLWVGFTIHTRGLYCRGRCWYADINWSNRNALLQRKCKEYTHTPVDAFFIRGRWRIKLCNFFHAALSLHHWFLMSTLSPPSSGCNKMYICRCSSNLNCWHDSTPCGRFKWNCLANRPSIEVELSALCVESILMNYWLMCVLRRSK